MAAIGGGVMQDISGMAQDIGGAEKVLPSKIQTLGFLVARALQLCERISTMTSRCGVPMPVVETNRSDLQKECPDYITQLEMHLNSLDAVLQSMDNYMAELERII